MNVEDNINTWFSKTEQVSPVRLSRFKRDHLAKKFHEWGFHTGAEIGVDRGRYSKVLLDANPNLTLYCVDEWYWKFRGESRYNSTVERLKPFGSRAEIMRMTSVAGADKIADGFLDFVYIDANHHFDYVMQDIIIWAKKVRIGGVISGHDYYRFRQAGVVDAVDVYTKMHGVKKWFLTDDRTPSWFWIRERDPWEK